MRVEAIRIENGFFIPMIDALKNISQDKIMIDIVEQFDAEYHDLDHLFGSWTEEEFQGKIDKERKIDEELWHF